MIKNSVKIEKLYNSELFRNQGHELIDLIADYLDKNNSGELKTVLPNISVKEMMDNWDGNFNENPSEGLSKLFGNVISQSNHLHNPAYLGHQVSAPLPLAALCDLLGRFLNNASAVYEMGMANIAMEQRIVNWMINLIGLGKESDGILTSGGTIGNLTALLAARQIKADYDIWSDGVNKNKPLGLITSEQAHYSVVRAAGIMGLGEKSVIKIPVNDRYQMNIDELEQKYRIAKENGINIIAVVGSAGSTATGIYDDLGRIGDFCQKNNLWFHVDGAHGSSALLSDKYKSLLNGIQKADSVIWDAHKMLLMPALITAVIFKNGASSYASFSQKASYLFEKESQEEWYNLAQRTMECTKTMMGLKLYICLSVFGTRVFSEYVTRMYDLTKEFALILKNDPDFELAVEPDCNIICFRYLKSMRKDLNEFQKETRKKLLNTGNFYITQTQLKNNFFLRCTVINPLTKIDDIRKLLKTIKKVAENED